jgi:hypothetical protein
VYKFEVEMTRPIVINFFAGPGAGKSTSAAFVFAELKMNGINCELVREYAKDKVWERNEKVFQNQLYIFGKQSYRMSVLHDEIDVIITDSPLVLSAIYNTSPSKDWNRLVLETFRKYENINYFLLRDKKYNKNGRYQNEQEAQILDQKIKQFLNQNNISFNEFNSNRDCYKMISEEIFETLK